MDQHQFCKKKMKQSALLEHLIKVSEELNTEAEFIDHLSIEQLTQRPNADAWNALECFEHVNLYIDIYNEFIEDALRKANLIDEDQEIRRGYFGNMFINMMEPKEKGIKKMNTFKSKNPMGKSINKSVVQHFIKSNSKTIEFLKEAKSKDIQTVKCKLALPLLKLKLSDAIHFLIAHNQRHMQQIRAAVA